MMAESSKNNIGQNEFSAKFNELRTIFDNLPEGVVVLLDHDMNIVAANQTVSAFLGYSLEEIVGKKSDQLFRDDLTGFSEIIKETIQNNRPVKNFTLECTTKRGDIRSFLVNTALISKSEKAKCAVVLILNDISEVTRLREQDKGKIGYGELVGNSPKMQELYTVIDTIKDYNTAILITGETGTGKELVARAIHFASDRSTKPFIPVQCSALPEQLLESELFGHVKGSFTGATKDKRGRFIIANSGTLFLDEVGTLSESAQIKLLRILQEKVVEPIGSDKQIPVDVRIISATNRDLSELVAKGLFRSDLYYRLKVFQLELSPLRDRKTDIPLLVDHFIARLNRFYNKKILGISQKVSKNLIEYYWPGNVRELENSIEHAFVLATGSLLELRHFPSEIRLFESNHRVLKPPEVNLSLEEENLRRALIASLGNMNKAAEYLKMHRTTLWRKMREFGIEKGFGK
jgi:PAS domain S-box-containing protein